MSKNLLVADDSLTIRKVIGMIFSTDDIKVTAVDNGLEAIAKARELKPDLVLADVLMPGKSGYEVSEALKGDPSTQHIPVLLLAGTFEPFDENRGLPRPPRRAPCPRSHRSNRCPHPDRIQTPREARSYRL
jgi:CheY-like chemotaxis protein